MDQPRRVMGGLALVLYISFAFFFAVTNVAASFSSEGESAVVKDERYQRGKERYEAIKAETKMPKYSKCWTNALKALAIGCKHLDDDMQHRLALAFANCFLQKTGRETYPCSQDIAISECVGSMKPEAYNTYTEFFTHTQNICYFLEAQVWQAETKNTVNLLTENTARVVVQIEDASELQGELLKKQNDSLSNQEILLARGNELRGALEESAGDVQLMMKEFKQATAEQRANILDVFDRIQSLQSLVMGEFTGFYSMIFYTTSLIVSYLLTSTPRTNGARFWLFFLMTLNVVAERLLVSYGAEDHVTDTGQVIDHSTVIYSRLQICRKVSCVFGILLLLVKVMLYEDLNKVNNQLLQSIAEQNQQIKHLLQSSAVSPACDSDTSMYVSKLGSGDYIQTSDQVDSALGYESDSDSDTSFDSGTTDHTFKVDDDVSVSDAESFLTSLSKGSRSSTPALLEELRGLRHESPLKGQTTIPGGEESSELYHSELLNSDDARTSTPQKKRGRPPGRRTPLRSPLNISEVPSPQSRYNLRNRSVTPTNNPAMTAESANDFGRVVSHLAKVSMRNSLKTKFTLQRMQQDQRF